MNKTKLTKRLGTKIYTIKQKLRRRTCNGHANDNINWYDFVMTNCEIFIMSIIAIIIIVCLFLQILYDFHVKPSYFSHSQWLAAPIVPNMWGAFSIYNPRFIAIDWFHCIGRVRRRREHVTNKASLQNQLNTVGKYFKISHTLTHQLMNWWPLKVRPT